MGSIGHLFLFAHRYKSKGSSIPVKCHSFRFWSQQSMSSVHLIPLGLLAALDTLNQPLRFSLPNLSVFTGIFHSVSFLTCPQVASTESRLTQSPAYQVCFALVQSVLFACRFSSLFTRLYLYVCYIG